MHAYLNSVVNFFTEDPKAYFAQFENDRGFKNSRIPNGDYAVYVDYNTETKEINVTNILLNGKAIHVSKSVLKIYEGINEFFNKVYEHNCKNIKRQIFTDTNIRALCSIRDGFSKFLTNVDTLVNKHIGSLSYTTISELTSKTIQNILQLFSGSDNMEKIKTTIIGLIDVFGLADEGIKVFIKKLVQDTLTEKMKNLIERVKQLLTTRTNNFYNIATLQRVLKIVIPDIQSVIPDAIDTADITEFMKL